MKPEFDIGQILSQHWEWIENAQKFSAHQLRMLKAISICRTEALGGRTEHCENCDFSQTVYNSCRNRNCPKCQGRQRQEWIEKRESELLPVPYFHVVFTVPGTLNPLFRKHPVIMANILFKAAWLTIKTFANDPKWLGAKPAMTAILHTWGQTMSLHPHLHCIVPGGGLTASGEWKNAQKSKGKFLFPVKAMGKVFRAKFVALLRKQAESNNIVIDDGVFKQLFQKKWVVFAKRPFLGPKQVIEYLGRYTHKIAISNYRILDVTPTHVTFSYKDYRDISKNKTITLPVQEFIRRFAMHIIPHGFRRIRHYGFLGSRFKKQNLQLARKSLGISEIQQDTHAELYDFRYRIMMLMQPGVCPQCKGHTIICKEIIPRKRDPTALKEQNPIPVPIEMFGTG